MNNLEQDLNEYIDGATVEGHEFVEDVIEVNDRLVRVTFLQLSMSSGAFIRLPVSQLLMIAIPGKDNGPELSD